MAESERNQSFETVVPKDAVEIKVTNIVNPYFIRIQELPADKTVKTNLFRELQKVIKSQRKEKKHKQYTPAVGDDVLLSHDRLDKFAIDLPDWICRGVITDTAKQTTDVFLLDFGIVINVPTDSLIKYSRNSVKLEPLTITVGLYNILPIDSTTWKISEQWPKSTIKFIKDLIQTSEKIYFQVLACDRKLNKKYGDIYLVVEDKNVSLIKILILTCLAVPLYPGLLRAIKNSSTTDEIMVPYQIEQRKIEINNESPVKTSAYNKLSLIRTKNYMNQNKQINEKILISTKVPCRPLEHSEDAKFTTEIHKALKMQGVRTLKQIQSYMWPAIKQGFDTVAISPHGAGKSVGYIVPIINNIAVNGELILDKHKKEIVTKPIALFLCATIKKCIDVADMCNKVLNCHISKVKYSAMYNGLDEKILIANICNKFNILVSTPPFLLRTIEKYSHKLDLSEISYLVIDQADVLLNKYFTELITLIKKYKINNKENKNGIQSGSVQIVAAAQYWTDKIRLFVDKYMEDPYICIGSFVEAAAFSRVKGRMLIRHSDKKKEEVLNILNDYTKVKTMILCLNSEEAVDLNNFLISKSIKTLLVHEEIPITKVNEIKEDWHKNLPGKYPVIICTDQILSDLQISNIELLIHYSITNTSKTLFGRRFSVFMDNWLMEPKIDCRVIILFDESKGNKHFKGVVEILKRLNVTLPEDWKQIAEGLDLAYNKTIKNHPLCDSIKSFGICENNSCPYRHCIVSEVDTPTLDVTIGDELRLEITHIHHASHFSARIYESIRKCEIAGKKNRISYPFEALELNNEMKKYYTQNRRGVKDISVGETCAYRNPEKNYTRVQILSIVEKDIRTDKPKKVQVQSLDDGQIFAQVYVSELFELPEFLLKYKCTVVNVFLTGVAPFDHEYEWTYLATQETKDWKKKNCNSDLKSYAYVKVLLHIGNSIWTDTVLSRSKLIGYSDLVSSTLNDALMKKELATSNDEHLPKLLNLCYNGGITEINGRSLKLIKKENIRNGSIDECD